MRKPAFCICENKDADQLRGNREADQRLCFRYTDSTIPLLPKSEISSFYLSSVAVQPGLCRTWSETPKTGFLTRLKLHRRVSMITTVNPLVTNGICHHYHLEESIFVFRDIRIDFSFLFHFSMKMKNQKANIIAPDVV